MPEVAFQPTLIAQAIEQIAKDTLIGMLLHPGMSRELPMPEHVRPRRITRLNPLLRIEVHQLGRRGDGRRLEMPCLLRHPSDLPTCSRRDLGMVLSRPQADFLVAVRNVQAGYEPVEQLPVCTQLGKQRVALFLAG